MIFFMNGRKKGTDELKRVAVTDKKKRVATDMLINLVGTGLPLVALQLIVYPIVARQIDADSYGRMQSLVSVIFLISGTLGGALSTTRLIHQYDYDEKGRIGDFSVLNLCSIGVVAVATPIVIYFYLGEVDLYELILITVISVLNYAELYYEVGLRLKLNYRKIFINKLIGAIGYLIGFLIFRWTVDWHYIFISAYLLQTLYCVSSTELYREPVQKTDIFADTTRSYGNITIASAFNKSLTYFDKILLHPLLGGEAVSVYFAANIFGKLIMQVLEPITNVVLSYLSKEKKVSRSIWGMTISIGIGFCATMYILCLLVSRFVLSILYPQFVDEAMKLIPVSTLSLCVSSFVNIIHPLALKTIKTNRQIVISGAGLACYIILALTLYKPYGLMGCCIALLVSYIIKLTLILLYCFVIDREVEFQDEE